MGRAEFPDAVEVAAVPADPWGTDADALVARSRGTVLITGSTDRPGLLTRLEIAERLRLAGVRVITEGPRALLPDLAAGLAAGRTDHIALADAS